MRGVDDLLVWPAAGLTLGGEGFTGITQRGRWHDLTRNFGDQLEQHHNLAVPNPSRFRLPDRPETSSLGGPLSRLNIVDEEVVLFPQIESAAGDDRMRPAGVLHFGDHKGSLLVIALRRGFQ